MNRPWMKSHGNMSFEGWMGSSQSFLHGPMVQHALHRGLECVQSGVSGVFDEGDIPELEKLFKRVNLKPMFRNLHHFDAENKCKTPPWSAWGDEMTIVTSSITKWPGQEVSVWEFAITSMSPEFEAELRGDLAQFLTAVKEASTVYALMPSGCSVSFTNIGKVDEVQVLDSNYNPSVIEDVDHVTEDLGEPMPCGRISIIHGPPGTGKTFLLRRMIQEVTTTRFCIIPSNLIRTLTEPAGAEALVNFALESPQFQPRVRGGSKKSRSRRKSITLIIEDGDRCLAKRAGDNLSDVENILNLGDGIIGGMMDIRLILTSNLPKHEFDAAILRDGRLCRQIYVDSLSPEQAAIAFAGIAPDKPIPDITDTMSLATVYRLAAGGTSSQSKKRGLGFTK